MAKVNDVFPNFRPWETQPGRDCSVEFAPDVDGVQVSSSLDVLGRELPDPTPMAPPVGMSAGPSLADFVHRMIRQEVSRAARAAEMESFDEADDFDVEDDPVDELTPYEKHFEGDKVPEDWPMYFNPRTGLYGQLPPGQAAPEGFVQLERDISPPKGFSLPRDAQRQRGGGEEASHNREAPAAPPGDRSGARVPQGDGSEGAG